VLPLNEEPFLQKYAILHEECKNNGLVVKNFIILDLYRQALMSFIVAFFFPYPFVQITLVTIFYFTYSFLFLFFRPIKSKIAICLTFLIEFICGLAIVSAFCIMEIRSFFWGLL